MIQRRDGLGFTLEALAELRGGNFDGDVAIQTRVAGAIHFAHAARADGREDLVRTEFIAGESAYAVRAEFSRLRADRERLTTASVRLDIERLSPALISTPCCVSRGIKA